MFGFITKLVWREKQLHTTCVSDGVIVWADVDVAPASSFAVLLT